MNRVTLMRVTVVVLLAFLLAAYAGDKTTIKPEAGWVRFTSEEGRFSVLMPSAPVYTEDTQKSELGDIKIHMYFSDQSPASTYGVMYNTFPKKVRKELSKEI